MHVIFITYPDHDLTMQERDDTAEALIRETQSCRVGHGLLHGFEFCSGNEEIRIRLEFMAERAQDPCYFLIEPKGSALAREALKLIRSMKSRMNAPVFIVTRSILPEDLRNAPANAIPAASLAEAFASSQFLIPAEQQRETGAQRVRPPNPLTLSPTQDPDEIPANYAAYMAHDHGMDAILRFDYVFTASTKEAILAVVALCAKDHNFLKVNTMMIDYEEVDHEYHFVPTKKLPLRQAVLDRERSRYKKLAHTVKASLHGPFITSSRDVDE